MSRYDRISKIFNENELLLLEESLRVYQENHPEKTDRIQPLYNEIVAARRWCHQFGKCDHSDG